MRSRLFVVFLLLASLTACAPPAVERADGVLRISKEQAPVWLRNFNPLGATGGRWPTRGGIYESLLIYNSMLGDYVPWLATTFRWNADGTQLRFETREGVRWSDGQPFGPDDVVFTFDLLKKHRALDVNGIWAFLAGVERVADNTIVFRFKRPFVPGLHWIAHQVIVPKHIWKTVKNPLQFENPNPVATGPFTRVESFSQQVFQLGRNPDYWQAGKPQVRALRFPAIPSNEQAILGLLQGEIDWSANFVPAIDRIFVKRDPKHNHYWFPLVGSSVYLYPNHQRKALANIHVRRALSMAINRKRMVQIAAYNYARPADATGLSDGYASWKDKRLVQQAEWTRFNPKQAARELDEAGYKRRGDGWRYGPAGEPVRFELIVVSGWSDWQRAAQLVARDAANVGIRVRVKPFEYSAWWDRLQRGDFDLAIGWSVEGPTPYSCYRWLMSPRTVKPVGEPAPGNWHRYGSSEALAIFDAYEKSSDAKEQRRLGYALQRIFVKEVPAVPLYPNPSWGAYSTRHFEGFPSAKNPYALLSPNIELQFVFTLLHLKPKR